MIQEGEEGTCLMTTDVQTITEELWTAEVHSHL